MARCVLFWMNGCYWSCLPAHSGHVGAAGMSVPGAVGISGQAALSAGLTVQLTLVERQLGHALTGAHEQPLLEEDEGGRVMNGWGGERVMHAAEPTEKEPVLFAPEKQLDSLTVNHLTRYIFTL